MACLRILLEQAKCMVVNAILLAILLALKASPASKCQHKFKPTMDRIAFEFQRTINLNDRLKLPLEKKRIQF